MVSEQALLRCAKSLFPTAALCLGSLSDGRSTITEAIAAALRNSPDTWESDAIRQLIRICRFRTPTRVAPSGFPKDDTLLPLLPILNLPADSRRAIALAVSDIPTTEAAIAADLSTAELEQKIEKALRQLTFMQIGKPPVLDDLQTAAKQIPWNDTDTELLLAGIAESKEAQYAEHNTVTSREIKHIATSGKATGKTVAIPLWGMILGIAIFIALAIAVLLLWSNLPHPNAAAQTNSPHTEEVVSLFSASYISIEKAQEIAAQDIGTDAANVCFLNSKLVTDASPPHYILNFTVRPDKEYEYTLDAVSGSISSRTEYNAKMLLDTTGWLPAEEIRNAARSQTGLQDVLFLKEKRTSDSEAAYYKFELLDAYGKLYSVQIDARNAMLMKYSVEELSAKEPENIISLAQAKARALSRVGDLDLNQVIFTKRKLDGGVYLLAFTLDDGTQYLIELNAEIGSINTIDIHPVSAEITEAIGLLAARDAALRMARLTEQDPVEYTKAKIDRSNGTYVYELEFQTPEYEYEVSINTSDGTIQKYRVWHR